MKGDQTGMATRDHGSDAPWYARLAQSILATSGPMALVGLGLAFFLAYSVTARLLELRTSIEVNRTMLQQAQVEMRAFAARQSEYDRVRQELLEKQLRLLRQLCVNSSKSDVALRGCVE